jgi:hypothetical protein
MNNTIESTSCRTDQTEERICEVKDRLLKKYTIREQKRMKSNKENIQDLWGSIHKAVFELQVLKKEKRKV